MQHAIMDKRYAPDRIHTVGLRRLPRAVVVPAAGVTALAVTLALSGCRNDISLESGTSSIAACDHNRLSVNAGDGTFISAAGIPGLLRILSADLATLHARTNLTRSGSITTRHPDATLTATDHNLDIEYTPPGSNDGWNVSVAIAEGNPAVGPADVACKTGGRLQELEFVALSGRLVTATADYPSSNFI
jgi:hypothetical protein